MINHSLLKHCKIICFLRKVIIKGPWTESRTIVETLFVIIKWSLSQSQAAEAFGRSYFASWNAKAPVETAGCKVGRGLTVLI